MPSISVVIPSFNRPRSLEKTLHFLSLSSFKDFEAIVVDQSTDSKVALFPSDPRFRRLIQKIPNLPQARNTGFLNSSAPIVLFLDDDVEFGGHLLEAHLRAHESLPEAGVVTGRIRLIPPDRWDDATIVAWLNPQTAKLVANYNLPHKREITLCSGCNMSFKREALAACGPFDTAFTGNALYEEIDMAFRIRQKGFRLFYAPDAEVTHVREAVGGCRTLKDFRYLYSRFRNTGYFFVNHLLRAVPFPLMQAIKNESEFYTRTKNGHAHFGAALLFIVVLFGIQYGVLKRFLLGIKECKKNPL